MFSCDPDNAGPETGCELNSPYDITSNGTNETHIFDIRPNPPLEIKNGTLEYDLFYQEISLFHNDMYPYPYNEYFIDSVSFDGGTAAFIKYSHNSTKEYNFIRNDCHIDLQNADQTLYCELRSGGDEISIKRYAIYNHQLLNHIRDTFLFLEFRNYEFKSLEKVIAEFASDNIGNYDTVAIELIYNESKE